MWMRASSNSALTAKSGRSVEVPKRCLEKAIERPWANKLNLSSDNEVLSLSNKTTQRLGRRPFLEGTALPLKEQVYSFRVLLDPGLQLEAHVSSV